MFCTNCGRELSDGLKFCIYCGVRLEEETVAKPQPPTEHVPTPNDWVVQPVASSRVEPIQDEEAVTGEAPKKGLLVLQDVTDSNKFYGCGLTRPVILGREASSCDMVIEGDKSVSRKHCRFFCRGNTCYVEDLNSFNHTFLNGALVEIPQKIRVGDHLRFGMVELVVAECETGS